MGVFTSLRLHYLAGNSRRLSAKCIFRKFIIFSEFTPTEEHRCRLTYPLDGRKYDCTSSLFKDFAVFFII